MKKERKTIPLRRGQHLLRLGFSGSPALLVFPLDFRDLLDCFQGHCSHLLSRRAIHLISLADSFVFKFPEKRHTPGMHRLPNSGSSLHRLRMTSV